jgi:hypothetical protein
MNRIRKHGDKYEVLVTPYHMYDSQMEIILGGWRDENLTGYSIKTFDTLQAAQEEAYNYPDIFWNKLISDHVEYYKILSKTLQNLLNDYLVIAELKCHLMTADELKYSMFNRIKRNDAAFRLYNNLNDIICFKIINPWTFNCIEISKKLIQVAELRIIKHFVVNKALYLIGETPLGTTYQIIVMSTLINQFIEWKKLHPEASQNSLSNMLNQSIEMQNVIDKNIIVR